MPHQNVDFFPKTNKKLFHMYFNMPCKMGNYFTASTE